jgi:hypothetical protein
MVLKRLVLERLALEQLVLERLAMAVPEPQHLTSLARWSARQRPPRRLVREGKRRLDARAVFHSWLETSKIDNPPHTTAIRGS